MHPKYKTRLKELCEENNVELEDILAKDKSKIISNIRRNMMGQMRKEFPHLSLVRLGSLFDRSYATVQSALIKLRKELVE